MIVPKGLTPFATLVCPKKLTLASLEESMHTVMIIGVDIIYGGKDIGSRHGQYGKAGKIIPCTIDEIVHHLQNFKF